MQLSLFARVALGGIKLSKDKIIPNTHPVVKVRPRFDSHYGKYFWHVICAVTKDKKKCEYAEKRDTHNGAHIQAAAHRRLHKSVVEK